MISIHRFLHQSFGDDVGAMADTRENPVVFFDITLGGKYLKSYSKFDIVGTSRYKRRNPPWNSFGTRIESLESHRMRWVEGRADVC